MLRGRLIDNLFPARVEKKITITTTGVLKVVVVVTPAKGYTNTAFEVFVDAYDPTGVMELGLLGWTEEVDYGDGVKTTYTQTAMPPWKHTKYYSAGSYTVTVKVTDEGTKASGTGPATVQVAAVLSMTFVADKTSGALPLSVVFTCGVSGGFPNYPWTLDPGDGSTPYTGTRTASGTWTQSHTYNKVGTFTAKLTVEDALGTTVMSQIGIGAGVPILFPRLRARFPRMFERIDKLRRRIPTR